MRFLSTIFLLLALPAFGQRLSSAGALAALSDTQAKQNVTSGLVGWWTFNNTTNDASGSSNNAALVNTFYTNGFPAAKGLYVATGKYASFGSTNLTGLTNWTVAAWVNVNYVEYSGLVVFGNEGIVQTHLTRLGLLHGGNVVDCSVDWTPYVWTWTHVACTYTASATNCYINGVLSNGSYSSDAGYGLAANYVVGYGYNGTAVTGVIDDVRIYNRALSAGEITTIYNYR